MKVVKDTTQEEILISIADLWRQCKKNQKKIFFCAFIGFVLAFYYTITTPVTYLAKGTFRDKVQSQGDSGSSMQALLKSAVDPGQGTATTLMKSRRVLSLVAKELTLQASIVEDKEPPSWDVVLHNIKLLREKNKILVGQCPVAKGHVLADCSTGIVCKDLQYTSHFYTPLQLEFLSEDTFRIKDMGTYQLGQNISSEEFSFRLERASLRTLKGTKYTMKLLPINEVCQDLSQSISITKDKLDKSLIVISYKSSDRHLATRIVNQVMSSYKQFLEEENQAQVAMQVKYLEQRQHETNKKLDTVLSMHSQYLQKHIAENNGLIDVEMELKFAAEQQNRLHQRLADIDLELELLKSEHQELRDHSGLYTNLFLKRKDLEQSRDLLSMQIATSQAKLKESDAYLGISLPAAEELFKSYNEQNDSIQTQAMHLRFAKQSLSDPQMEISSLSGVLKEDSVGLALIEDASETLKRLHDEKNLSVKEAERLRRELDYKRSFLTEHIQQALAMLEQEDLLLKQKMSDLRHTMLGAYQQEISVISNQLEAYKEARRAALTHEKELIKTQLTALNAKTVSLPEKWLKDQQMLMHTESHSLVVQELVRLVEAKNVAGNLAKNESNALDLAILPVFPQIPKLELFSLLGAFIGAFICVMVIVLTAIFRGVQASEENLFALGRQVAGTLGHKDLAVVRRVLSYLRPGHVVAVITGGVVDISSQLASLVTKKGNRAVILSCSLLQEENRGIGDPDGLLDYLEGRCKTPALHRLTAGYDYIYGGRYDPYAIEYMKSKRFLEYLKGLSSQYDYVFMVLPVSATSSEAENLRGLADDVVVTLHDEKLHEIRSYLEGSPERVSFVLKKT